MISFFVMHVSCNAMLQLTGKILADGSIAPGVLEGTIASSCGIMSLLMGVGGSMMIDGQLIQGGQNIFFAQLASPNVAHFSADATRYFSGITEPIEFSFLFVAPLLFGVQVVLAGAAYMIAHILNIAVGLTFSGGFRRNR